MGGNAMAKFGARRYSKEEADVVRYELFSAIKKYLPDLKFQEIPYYRMKDSFGDLDILVEGPLTEDHYETFLTICKYQPHVINGGVMSTLYENLQIDFIPMPPEDYETALTYYSYNDLGNLMGKTFHKFGLKYGHRGLTMPVRDGDHQFDEIVVSKDAREIFHFAGYSYRRFEDGFDTLKEIFDYVISTHFFSAETFQYENLNHTNRIRDKKRSTYNAFLEYLKFNWNSDKNYKFEDDKDEYLDQIFGFFPDALFQYHAAITELGIRKMTAEIYNGNLVSEITGLKGHYLGKLMFQIKKKYGQPQTWALGKTNKQIWDIIVAEYNDYVPFHNMSVADYKLEKI